MTKQQKIHPVVDVEAQADSAVGASWLCYIGKKVARYSILALLYREKVIAGYSIVCLGHNIPFR